jgi:hypothetical protein
METTTTTTTTFDRETWTSIATEWCADLNLRLERVSEETDDVYSDRRRAETGHKRSQRVWWTLRLFHGDRDLHLEYGDAYNDHRVVALNLVGYTADTFTRKRDAEAAIEETLAWIIESIMRVSYAQQGFDLDVRLTHDILAAAR